MWYYFLGLFSIHDKIGFIIEKKTGRIANHILSTYFSVIITKVHYDKLFSCTEMNINLLLTYIIINFPH